MTTTKPSKPRITIIVPRPKYKPLPSPLKWWGGKSDKLGWLTSLLPPRVKKPNSPAKDDPGWCHSVEPFAGGASLTLALDPNGISQVINDLDGRLMNFYDVLTTSDLFQQFMQRVGPLPFSEPLQQRARNLVARGEGSKVDRAVAFFILNRQSRAGDMKGFTPLTRQRTRGGRNAEVNAWLSAVTGLPELHRRLQNVVVVNRPAVEVIRREDTPRSLHYCDPPYVHTTRASTGNYRHEMTDGSHRELLQTLEECEGKVMLSAYRNDMYDQMLHSWRRVDATFANSAASGETKRKMVESVYLNYLPSGELIAV